MNTQKITIAVLALTLLSACGGSKHEKSKSMDKDGNCSSSFIEDYNSVIQRLEKIVEMAQSKSFSKEEAQVALISARSACNRLESYHSGISCNTKDDSSGKIKNVSSSNFSAECEKIRSLLKDAGL